MFLVSLLPFPYMKTFALAAALAISAVPLFASSDLSITIESNSAALAGTDGWVSYSIHNAGPDTASGVVVKLAMTGATDVTCPGVCSGVLIEAGGTRELIERMTFMDEPGTVTITATVSSSASDPDTADNSVTLTLVVPPDPDVTIFPNAPQQLDLGLPFRLGIIFGNRSAIPAHDVNATIDFRTDVSVQSLPPDGCVNPMPGRITCHLDEIKQGNPPAFNVTLVAPATYGTGSITFAATVTEREHDFDPVSNTSTRISQLNNTFLVTSTANDGTGSLRQAILDANAFCLGGPLCSIAFRIAEPSTTGWKTIRITSPLPALTASNIRIDGASQSTSVGDGNPDGPDIEISGGGTVDGDGLTVGGCLTEVANLAINGFRRNGLSVTNAHPDCRLFPQLHDLFIGTDATGSEARPNGQRGIGIFVPPNSYGGGAEISSCVISGNALSGIFDLSGLMSIWGNRIGVKAHNDDPLPNGASGIFIGPGGGGSAIGADYLTPTLPGNVIAFNREMGVAIAPGITAVSVSGNRIWSNGGLGIDIGLDGPTMSTTSILGTLITTPTLTLAHYDPVSKRTIVEGDTTAKSNGSTSTFWIDFFANDAAGHFGFGEGQRPIAATSGSFTATHFHIECDGDLTGQFISATLTTMNYEGFAKPEGTDQGFLTQTSEFSRAIEVR
jgi:hypothetical protein